MEMDGLVLFLVSVYSFRGFLFHVFGGGKGMRKLLVIGNGLGACGEFN